MKTFAEKLAELQSGANRPHTFISALKMAGENAVILDTNEVVAVKNADGSLTEVVREVPKTEELVQYTVIGVDLASGPDQSVGGVKQEDKLGEQIAEIYGFKPKKHRNTNKEEHFDQRMNSIEPETIIGGETH